MKLTADTTYNMTLAYLLDNWPLSSFADREQWTCAHDSQIDHIDIDPDATDDDIYEIRVDVQSVASNIADCLDDCASPADVILRLWSI